MTRTLEILDALIAFETVSQRPNAELIGYLCALLDDHGISYELVGETDGTRMNLFATVGPAEHPGVVLSGHTDVVPVAGQAWSRAPFRLEAEGGRLYGRGTTDMKGFLACAMDAALTAAGRDLRMPLHLAFSYDEEIGCVGVRHLLEHLAERPVQPRFCIIGEPTELAIATGHKGKTSYAIDCRGKEVHSALAPQGINALHLAADVIQLVRRSQAEIADKGARDGDYDVPYTTLHAGVIAGGTALNIVPNHCRIEFEIRNLKSDDPQAILAGLEDGCADILAGYPAEADIAFTETNSYPGLDTPPDAEIVAFMKALTGANSTNKVAFGTEGGLFDQRLGVPCVVCGPGSMAQGHKPDEFIAASQIEACEAMLARLVDRLCS